ncbi:MAG: nuclease A inhibitor family protein [Gemmataceae bacterium]
MTRSNSVLTALRDATRGLLFPSESDAPFEAFLWPPGSVDAASLLVQIGLPADTPLESLTLTELVRSIPSSMRGNFLPLATTLVDQVSGVKVYKVGSANRTVYIIGTTADGFRAGVKVEAIET